MPFRKTPRLMRDWERKIGEPMGSVGAIAFVELLAERIYAIVRIIGIEVIIAFIVLAAMQFQITARNRSIDELQEQTKQAAIAAKEAKEASNAATLALNAAIENSKSGNDASMDAINRIRRIEEAVCHGPCPPVQP